MKEATKINVENLKKMEMKFSVGICNRFIIHGNTDDFLPLAGFGGGYVRLNDYLTTWLKGMDLVIFFDIATGLSFLDKNHEQKFRKLTGLCKPEPKIDRKEMRNMTPEQQERLKQAIQELEQEPDPPLPDKPVIVLKLVRDIMNNSHEKEEKGDHDGEKPPRISSMALHSVIQGC